MFRNYVTIALRSIMRQKGYSALTIIGLAVGISACLLVWLFVSNELAYDKQHSKLDRLYRVTSNMTLSGQTTAMARSSWMVSPTLKKDYPEIEEATRLMPMNKQPVWFGDKVFTFEKLWFTEAAFFKMFDYNFIEGNPAAALAEPNSVVITDEVARKYFGTEQGVVGKMLQFSKQSYKITGVVRYKPYTSHIEWEMLLSASSLQKKLVEQLESDWFYMAQFTYVLFKDASKRAGFEAKLQQVHEKYIVPFLKTYQVQGNLTYALQPVSEIHFDTSLQFDLAERTNKSYLIILSLVGVFILLVASINYMNLATARSLKRAKDVAVRKTIGAERLHLIGQFIGESLVITTVAVVIAIVAAELFLPTFNALTGKSLQFSLSFGFVGTILAIILFVGVAAGSYPALYLSGFRPMDVMKSIRAPKGGAATVRKTLVVVQFSISIALIIATGVVYLQMQFMKNKDLGFAKDQTLVLKVPMQDSSVTKQLQLIKNEFLQNSAITRVAGMSTVPGSPFGQIFHVIQNGSAKEERAINIVAVDEDLMPMLGIQMSKGRSFSKDFPADKERSFIVNEAAVRTYGWKSPVGMKIENGLGYSGEIIGVVKDFHFTSLHSPIEPLVMVLVKQTPEYLMLKVRPENMTGTIAFIEEKWKRFSTRFPMEYYFLDDHFNKQYRAEERLQTVFLYFATVTVIIACMGLFGLAAYSAEQRTKEIGIRKVLGASSLNIIGLLSVDFLKLVSIALVVATPLAYWAATQWLQDFAFRVSLGAGVFVGAGALAVAIVFITVAGQAWRAAKQNPVKSLRTE
ncbi:MAG: ABC transporter permease [Candidatus Kapaibacterium sp.]|nr:MAG: ABC transporter permease [Candidatus Kapabacteria bacterium]